MPKYTKEFKIKVVMEYLSGKSGGQPAVSKKYKIPEGTLVNWINKYRMGGFKELNKKSNNSKYTGEFKLSVIQYRQINNISYRETAEHFGINNRAIIYNWQKIYQERGLSGLKKQQGRPRKNMLNQNKKSKLNNPINETEREELIRLREENRLLKMKIIYEKKLQALLLEQEAEARKKQR